MNDELQGDSREYKEAARMYNHDLKEYYRQHNYQVKPDEEEENEPTSQTGDLSLEEINYYLRKGFNEAEKNKNSTKSFKVAQGYGGNVMRDFSTPLFVNKQNSSDKKDSDLFFTMTDNEFRENVYPLLNVCEELYQKMEKYDPEVHKGGVDWFDACRIGFNQRFSANRYDEKYAKYAKEKCLEKGKLPSFCGDFSRSVLECLREVERKAQENHPVAYTGCHLGPGPSSGIEKNIPAIAIEVGGKSIYNATGKRK